SWKSYQKITPECSCKIYCQDGTATDQLGGKRYFQELLRPLQSPHLPEKKLYTLHCVSWLQLRIDPPLPCSRHKKIFPHRGSQNRPAIALKKNSLRHQKYAAEILGLPGHQDLAQGHER